MPAKGQGMMQTVRPGPASSSMPVHDKTRHLVLADPLAVRPVHHGSAMPGCPCAHHVAACSQRTPDVDVLRVTSTVFKVTIMAGPVQDM